jgi:hypothetical protein
MRHKVNTFILKNPPENKLSKEERRSVLQFTAQPAACCLVQLDSGQQSQSSMLEADGI